MSIKDKYSSYAELEKHECEGKDFLRYAVERSSSVAIFAIHGGNIEPGTSEIAKAIAGEDFSLYCFEGLKPRGNRALHIASHNFDEPSSLVLVGRSRIIVAVHGCDNKADKTLDCR